MDNSKRKLTFWGVRGSIPVPGKETAYFGGNTPCISVIDNDLCIILDAGSGIREFANYLINNNLKYKSYNILLTHFHHDHLLGFQYFAPLFFPETVINIYAPILDKYKIEDILGIYLKRIFFPVKLNEIKAEINYFDFKPDDSILVDGRKIKTVLLNHPNYSVGYSFTINGKKICYLTDTEMINRIFINQESVGATTTTIRKLDSKLNYYSDKLISFAYDSDILIFDSQYTEEEYSTKQGWGHSTSDDALFVASRANAKKLFLFHHDPLHTDTFLKKQLIKIKEKHPYYFEKFEIYVSRERESCQL